VRQRVLEHAAIAKPVVDSGLQVVELVAQPHHSRSDILTVALDDAPRILGG